MPTTSLQRATSLEARRRPRLERALLPTVAAGLVGLALFVYFFRLGVPTWRGDEVFYRGEARAQGAIAYRGRPRPAEVLSVGSCAGQPSG